MKRMWMILILVVLSSPTYLNAQETVPFKLGTFADGAEPYVGLVLDDSLVVDIAQANDALPGGQAVIPEDMKELIVRYPELRPRLRAIAAAASSDAGRYSAEPLCVHQIAQHDHRGWGGDPNDAATAQSRL